MKKTFGILALLAIFSLCFIGCSRDDSDDFDSTESHYIRLTVNGVEKSGIVQAAQLKKYYPSNSTQEFPQLEVFAKGFGGNPKEAVLFDINNFKEKGTFKIAPNNEWTRAQYALDNTNTDAIYANSTGTIVVTAYSGTAVKGTFEFTAKAFKGSTITITKGEFYLPLEKW